jgi:hypothetical protein
MQSTSMNNSRDTIDYYYITLSVIILSVFSLITFECVANLLQYKSYGALYYQYNSIYTAIEFYIALFSVIGMMAVAYLLIHKLFPQFPQNLISEETKESLYEKYDKINQQLSAYKEHEYNEAYDSYRINDKEFDFQKVDECYSHYKDNSDYHDYNKESSLTSRPYRTLIPT